MYFVIYLPLLYRIREKIEYTLRIASIYSYCPLVFRNQGADFPGIQIVRDAKTSRLLWATCQSQSRKSTFQIIFSIVLTI